MPLQRKLRKPEGLVEFNSAVPWHIQISPLKERMIFMKLNIYSGKDIVKTYETDDFDLTYGVIEDVIEIIDGKDLENKNDLINVAIDSFHLLRPLLKQVFDGLTDDELRTVKIRELIVVIVELIKASISNLKMITGDDVKNVLADSLH